MDCWWIAWLRLAASYFLRDWLKQQSVGFKGKRKKNLKRQQQLLRGFIFTWSVVSAGRNLFRPQLRPDTIQTLALDEEKTKQNNTYNPNKTPNISSKHQHLRRCEQVSWLYGHLTSWHPMKTCAFIRVSYHVNKVINILFKEHNYTLVHNINMKQTLKNVNIQMTFFLLLPTLSFIYNNILYLHF